LSARRNTERNGKANEKDEENADEKTRGKKAKRNGNTFWLKGVQKGGGRGER